MSSPTRGAVALTAAALVACGGGASDPAPPPDERPESHRRMVALLAQVEQDSRGANPYLGEQRVRAMEAELDALPDAPDLRRWFFHLRLGRDTLRLGRIDTALEHYRTAYDQLERWRDEMPLEYRVRTVFEYASAMLRLAETRNCVARHTADSCLLPVRAGGVHADREGTRRASELLRETLSLAPPNSVYALRARWLLNITEMLLGRWPDGVEPRWRLPPAALASDEPWPRFVDVAPALGVASFDLAGGVIADDFDGDGRLDLLVSSSDTARSLRLFRNTGRGFEERVEEAGLEGITGGLNLMQADHDGDGDLDVLVLRGAWWRAEGRHPNSLLRNDGSGRFDDVTFAAGLGEAHWPTQAAAWADYDLDGDLDLYVGNEADPNVPAAGQLFRNEGDGTFVDVAASAGVENLRYAKAVAWGDVDDDGDPDLYVSNMGAANRLYRNEGNETFVDVARAAGVEGPQSSFPCWFWDVDDDGRLDLYVAGYGGAGIAPDVADVAASYFGLTPRGERDRLYRNRGDGTFVDVAAEAGLDGITLPMGANFGDIDFDGRLDLYLGTGYPHYEGLMPNVLLRRAGDRFADVSSDAGVGHLQKGHGIAFADLDHDGDQEIYAQMGGMYPGDAFGNALFDNPGPPRAARRLLLSLVGESANRFGVGARLRVVVREGDATRTLHRLVSSGGSFGANPLRVEIGLGSARAIERVEIDWPVRGGTTQVVERLEPDRWYEIRQGERSARSRELPAVTFPLPR